ncbi:hypothetical protein GCM10027416_03650 [Okibacterium endophyticum]
MSASSTSPAPPTSVLTAEKAAELKKLFNAVNPADLTRDIIVIQTRLPRRPPRSAPAFREQNQVRHAPSFRAHLDTSRYAGSPKETTREKQVLCKTDRGC